MGSDAAPPADLVRLFTDGACSGNPGPGGWAYILRHPATGRVIDASGAEAQTTNNRMELAGAIEGLASLKRPCRVTLVTDSQYVGKGLSQWLTKWKRDGWQRREQGKLVPVKNDDLWRKLDALATTHHVRYHPILGHDGHPENERCDALAVEAYQQYR